MSTRRNRSWNLSFRTNELSSRNQRIVILSEVIVSRSEAITESKNPYHPAAIPAIERNSRVTDGWGEHAYRTPRPITLSTPVPSCDSFRSALLAIETVNDEVQVMMKSQKFFRYVWRINAVLILVAAGTATFAIGSFLVEEFSGRVQRSRNAEAEVPVGYPDAKLPLSLQRATTPEGTNVMRAQLVRNGSSAKFSGSGDMTEVRNILFIDPAEKAARWLLPDNDHIIDGNLDAEERDAGATRTVATVVLVKPQSDGQVTDKGKLVLFDLPGKKIVEVADGVQELQVASVAGAELTILYKQDRRLVLAAFDSGTFAKRREQPIDVPQLK